MTSSQEFKLKKREQDLAFRERHIEDLQRKADAEAKSAAAMRSDLEKRLAAIKGAPQNDAHKQVVDGRAYSGRTATAFRTCDALAVYGAAALGICSIAARTIVAFGGKADFDV